ncbi:hypothetical protein SLS62_010828 [Diatrype stigma]|uniref:Uncharacterized protein n=1 Tax=Diatrype stigma TaxID=117547 RepID=A0AAN9UEH6_9PEZI
MSERDQDSENSQPRKRIAVAVSSTETPLKDQDFPYNIDASRAFSARATVSPLHSVSQYPAELPAGDMLAYRQGSYAYGNKGYYSGVSGWTSANPPEDGVEYVGYHPYQMMSQDASFHMMQSYGRYGSSKSVYVDPEASGYSYGPLVHRPAVNDSPNFSLSGMADSLPSTSSARAVPSDRLLPQVTRTLASPSYRTDGLPELYSSKPSAPHASSSTTDAYGSLNSSFESSGSYAATGTVPSSIPHRSASQSDTTTAYQSSSTSSADTLYHTGDQSLRPTDDSGTSLGYIYNDRDSARRDSHSSATLSPTSTLSNGHVYVPGSHHHGHTHGHGHTHAHASAQGYVVSGSSAASQGAAIDGATTAVTRSGHHHGGSHLHTESHRRSAGSLRGGG